MQKANSIECVDITEKVLESLENLLAEMPHATIFKGIPVAVIKIPGLYLKQKTRMKFLLQKLNDANFNRVRNLTKKPCLP